MISRKTICASTWRSFAIVGPLLYASVHPLLIICEGVRWDQLEMVCHSLCLRFNTETVSTFLSLSISNPIILCAYKKKVFHVWGGVLLSVFYWITYLSKTARALHSCDGDNVWCASTLTLAAVIGWQYCRIPGDSRRWKVLACLIGKIRVCCFTHQSIQ